MARRVSLTDLSADPAVGLRAPATVTPVIVPVEVPKSVTPEVPKSGSRWDMFERKEARLRPDQIEDLAAVARRLNRARRGQGQRITENTLIRIAVDELLARAEQLSGVDEGQLRDNLRTELQKRGDRRD
jgi:RNA polymerase-interacting CarD/CdnL/TRCF family regulator